MKIGILILTALISWIGVAEAEESVRPHNLHRLAEAGQPAAQYYVGMRYHLGIGVDQDRSAAFAWFQKSASGGDPLGSFKLACYYSGQHESLVQLDMQKAEEHMLVAAEAGYILAQFAMAELFASRGDMPRAVDWLDKAADQGHLLAHTKLLSLYALGDDWERDLEEAYLYYFRLEKLLGDDLNEDMRAVLLNTLATATPAEIEDARSRAEAWTPRTTALTQRAFQGLGAEQELLSAVARAPTRSQITRTARRRADAESASSESAIGERR